MRIQTIFCEDVRMELSGQATLIGVFPGAIFIPSSGLKTEVAQWIQIDGLDGGAHELVVSAYFVSDEERRIGNIDVSVTVVDPDFPTILTPTGLDLHASEEGKLVIRLSIDGAPVVESGSIRVQKMQEDDEADIDT